MFEINQLVVLIDDPKQIIYKIIDIKEESILLKGYKHRSIFSISRNKIKLASDDLIKKANDFDKKYINHFKQIKQRSKKHLFGRVLHIDGDPEYLKNCVELYNACGVNVVDIYIKEKDLPIYIEDIVNKVTPDIIVITGHDYYKGPEIKQLSNYENSKHFGEAIRLIRKHFSDVVIIAGACHSHFEYLMGQGANFATSPARIETHTFDPAIVAVKIATTSKNKIVDFNQILKYIDGKKGAIGGIETNGTMKFLY